MGLQIRDERQMKALTGLSQAQFDALLPVFRDIYQATQQQTYEDGVQSGTRRRRPGGGSKGKLPTMAEKLQSLNFSQFVECRSWWPWAREGRETAYAFAGDEPCTGEEIGRASARFDALQTNGMDPPTGHVIASRSRWLCA